MRKVLELQLNLWQSCNFKTYAILFVLQSYFEHYINKGCDHQLTLKNLCTWMSQSEGLTQNNNNNNAQFWTIYLPNLLITMKNKNKLHY
jgi:hypothetical protein